MTVTRALNGGTVHAETRQRILKLCAEMGYRQNRQAQGLRLNRSWLIGLVVSTVKHEFWGRVVDAVEHTLQNAGYHLVIVQSGRYFAWEKVEFLMSRNIDGLLLSSPCKEDVYRHFQQQQVPTVLLNLDTPLVPFPFVGCANRDGAMDAMRHLAALGHRRIAHLRGPAGEYAADERCLGYLQAVHELGLAEEPGLLVQANFHYDGGYRGVHELLERRIAFTALFAANDYVAMGASRALQEQGLRVPEDVSIIGFSGDEVGAYHSPPLTTMKEPVDEMVSHAIDILLHPEKRNDAQGSPIKLQLPTTFIQRASCARLANQESP